MCNRLKWGYCTLPPPRPRLPVLCLLSTVLPSTCFRMLKHSTERGGEGGVTWVLFCKPPPTPVRTKKTPWVLSCKPAFYYFCAHSGAPALLCCSYTTPIGKNLSAASCYACRTLSVSPPPPTPALPPLHSPLRPIFVLCLSVISVAPLHHRKMN